MLETIKSDLYRYSGKTDYKSFFKCYRKYSSFRFQVAFRLINSKGIRKAIGAVLWAIREKKHIFIPKQTKIGYGLYIGHSGPVLVNPTAVIGNNCNLSQCVSIGSNNKKAATIGDNVYIGPNAVVVEDVEIGNNVTIGAGSIVVKSIPDNATAAGNYAKVLNYDDPGRFILNKWEI